MFNNDSIDVNTQDLFSGFSNDNATWADMAEAFGEVGGVGGKGSGYDWGQIGEGVRKLRDVADNLAEKEAENDPELGSYLSDAISFGLQGMSIAGSLSGVGAILGAAIGVVVGLFKNLAIDLGWFGPSDAEISEDTEREISNVLTKKGVKIPDSLSKKNIMTGYDHDQQQKLDDGKKLSGMITQYGEGAADFISQKLKNEGQITPNRTDAWLEEYSEVRQKLELARSRIEKAFDTIAVDPENSKKRSREALNLIKKVDKDYPHTKYRNAAQMAVDKLESNARTMIFIYVGVGTLLLVIIIKMLKNNDKK